MPPIRSESQVYLVSCGSKKSKVDAKAKDLYISSPFKKARAYVEKIGQPWWILSAKHGLLDPETVISPYDQTLERVSEQKAWALEVLGQLEAHLVGVRSVTFLAGERYRKYLEPALLEKGVEVSVPMRGMGIGKQQGWLKRQLEACP